MGASIHFGGGRAASAGRYRSGSTWIAGLASLIVTAAIRASVSTGPTAHSIPGCSHCGRECPFRRAQRAGTGTVSRCALTVPLRLPLPSFTFAY